MKVKDNKEWIVDIFEKYGDKIYHLIASKINDDSDIDDIYQQLFLSLIQGPGLSHDHNILGYLYKAATHHIVDTVRLNKKNQHITYEYAKYQKYRITQVDPQRVAIQDEEREKRTKLIEKKLPRHEACAVIGHYIHGLDIGHLAKEMNIKERTLSRYLCIGLKKVRHLLNDDTVEISAPF